MGFGKSGTGVIIRELHGVTLSTLADQTAKFTGSLVLAEDFRMLKAEVFAIIDGLTATEGNNMMLGLANGELDAAEVGECIAIDGPLNRNDRLKQEQAERFVKLISVGHQGSPTTTSYQFKNETGGPQIVVKPQWTFSDPEGWQWFLFNNSGAALTTGATWRIVTTIYGVWVT